MMQEILLAYRDLSLSKKATIWFFVCSILQRGIITVTMPILTRLLTTEEFGRVSVFTSWLSIIQIIVTLQITGGVYTMGVAKFENEEAVFSSSLQGLNLVLCLSWTVIYLLFRSYWNKLLELTTVQVLSMLLIVWSSSAFTFWVTVERNHFRYKNLVIFTLIASVIKPLISIILVLNSHDKVTAYIVGLAIAGFICYSGFFVFQLLRGKTFYSKKFWKYVIIFNLPLLPHYLSGVILGSSDRIMIEKMVGASEAGIYNLAYSISLAMGLFNDALNKTMSPWLYQKVRDRNVEVIGASIYSSLCLIAFANLLLIAVAPEIVAIFAPAEYMDAVYVIPPVSISLYMNYLYLCFVPFEFSFEKRAWTTFVTLLGGATNVVLNFVFIPVIGYQAAGYTTLFCYTLTTVLHYFFMMKICKDHMAGVKPYKVNVLLLISGIFVGLGLLYIPTYTDTFVRYTITGILLFAILTRVCSH